jgi:hypothetical protein
MPRLGFVKSILFKIKTILMKNEKDKDSVQGSSEHMREAYSEYQDDFNTQMNM